MIANAGIAASAPLDKTDRSLWDQIIAVNLTGPFLTLREGLARMKAAHCRQGRLIAIASMTAKRAYPYISAYAASKHGVLGLVKSAALEVAALGTGGSESEQKNITVNAICPGYLDTEMTQSSIANIAEKTGLSSEQAAEKLHSFSPQKRLFTADEVAQAALYLASPAASGINGQALSIDGEKPGKTQYQLPVFSMDAQGSAGACASPSCSSSSEIPSGDLTKAMRPSRGGRLIVTPLPSV